MRNFLVLFCLTILLVDLASAGSAELSSANPSDRLTASNGMVAAVVNPRSGVVEEVFPRIYGRYDSLHRVEPFLTGLRLTGAGSPVRVGYHRHTHVIEAEYGALSIFYFAPLTAGERVFYVAVEGPESAVAEASFSWETIGARVRTLELTFPVKENRVRRYLLFAPVDSLLGEETDLRPYRARLLTYSGSLLDDEIQYMRMVIDRARLPRGLSEDERSVAEQSITVLKMEQVSPYDSEVHLRGKFVASFPPGERNEESLLAASYAILALSRIGRLEEAREGLRYLLRTDRSGSCDHNCGLFLLAYADYVGRSRDTTLLRESYLSVVSGFADPLVGLIQSNDLMHRDAGPWSAEARVKQHAFTSAVCAAGLREFARLGKAFGGTEWRRFARAAERLRGGIRKHLVVGGKYIGGYTGVRKGETGHFDAATFEVFGMGVIVDTTLFRSHLRVYQRRADADAVPGLIDFRIVSAMLRYGEKERANRLIRRATDQAVASHSLIRNAATAGYLLALCDARE